ncbi:invasion associated locus B family protein [Frigidibacter sp. MR17.14]|uniref:invasion associated locus B family protein n=1 Tax=Frigidibacter sp. MR17.14 TaxID=3126509 RepID=UPI003012D56E
MTDFTFARFSTVAALALGLALPVSGFAQTADAPATAAPAAPAADAPAAAPAEGQKADGPGTTYIEATHGDWQQRCIHTEDGTDPCQLFQLLKDQNGNSVAEFSLFGLPKGQQAVAGATIMTPLETLLTEQVTLQIDSSEAKRYPFTFCAPQGCVARVGFTQAEIDAMKKGNKATISISPLAAPNQKVALNVSLKGFTAGLDAVNEANKDSILKPRN